MPVVKITLSEAVEEYIDRRKRTTRFAESTLEGERYTLMHFAKTIEGNRGMQVRNLTPEHVFNYFFGENGVRSEHRETSRGSVRKPIKSTTHNKYRKRIGQLNDFCIKRGWTKVDWLEEVHALEEEEELRLQLTPHQLLELIESADNPRDRIYLVACVNTACRQSELKTLQYKDLDLAGGWLTVQVHKSRKTRKKPITADFDHELRQWLIYYQEQLGRPLDDDDYLFPHREAEVWVYRHDNPSGKRGYAERMKWILVPDKTIRKTEIIVQKALKRLYPEMDTRFQGTHLIRRSIALAFQKHQEGTADYGTALRATAELLNHKRTSTTEQYIGHNDSRAQVRRVMHGQPFLTAMVDDSNVVPLKAAESA